MIGIFLDTETNGLNPYMHCALQIAFRLINVITGTEYTAFQSIITPSREEWKKSDPSSLKINGFDWEEAQMGKTKEEVKEEIKKIFLNHKIERGNAVFICQNPSFDRAFFSQIIDPTEQEALLWPYHWLDLASMYWNESIRLGGKKAARYPWITGVSKDKIAETYKLPKENKPHRAMQGVDHLLLCYKAVVGFPQKL